MDNETPAQTQKKKRAYAATPAYEFGGNVGFQQGQPPPPMMGGGMPAPSLGMPVGQQPMGAPQMGIPGHVQQEDPLAHQFTQMNLQGHPMGQPVGQQQAQPMQQQQRQAPLAQNQLYPSDLISQPFRVEELDVPPPAINLPPGVRLSSFTSQN